MFTFLFIVFKIIGILHISWWWIILALLIDEETSVGAIRKERAGDIYQNIDEKYQNNSSEEEIEEILEEYGDDAGEDTITQELENRR